MLNGYKKITNQSVIIMISLMCLLYLSCSQIMTNRQFNSLVTEYIDSYYKFHSVESTLAGYGHYDNMVDNYADTSVSKYLMRLDHLKNRFAEFDTSLLAADRLIDYQIAMLHLDAEIWKMKHEQTWKFDASFYHDLIADAILGIKFSGSITEDKKCHFFISRLQAIKTLFCTAKYNLVDLHIMDLETTFGEINDLSYLLTSELNYYIHTCPMAQDTLFYFSKVLADSLDGYRKFIERKNTGFNLSHFRPDSSQFVTSLNRKFNLNLSVDELIMIAEEEYEDYLLQLNTVSRSLYTKFFPKRRSDDVLTADRVAAILDQLGNDYVLDNVLIDEIFENIEDLERFITMKNIMNLPLIDSLNVSRSSGYGSIDDITRLRKIRPLDASNVYRFYIKSLPDDLTWFEQVAYLREFSKTKLRMHTIQKLIPGTMMADVYWNRQKSKLRKIFKNQYIEAGWSVLATEVMIEYGYGGYDRRLQFLHYLTSIRSITEFIVDMKLHTGQIDPRTAQTILEKRGFLNSSAAKEVLKDVIANPANSVYRVYGAFRLRKVYEKSRKIAGNYFDSISFWDTFFDAGAIHPDSFEKSILNVVMKQYKKNQRIKTYDSTRTS